MFWSVVLSGCSASPEPYTGGVYTSRATYGSDPFCEEESLLTGNPSSKPDCPDCEFAFTAQPDASVCFTLPAPWYIGFDLDAPDYVIQGDEALANGALYAGWDEEIGRLDFHGWMRNLDYQYPNDYSYTNDLYLKAWIYLPSKD